MPSSRAKGGLPLLPLPLPVGTEYDRLGIRPEASADEVREAKAAAVNRLKAEQGQLPKDGPGAERRAEIDTQIVEINRLRLEDPDARREYNREHPPFSLLTLEVGSVPLFDDVRAALHLLRKDVAAFLEEAGDVAYHPSDLTRTDFEADFTFNTELDGRR